MSNLEIAALTDTGKSRDNNEDSIATKPELGLVVLADGMGGHRAGEVASGLAVEIISRHVEDKLTHNKGEASSDDYSYEADLIKQAVELANETVHETAQARVECAGMGSTVVAAIFNDNKIAVAHVGDSRLYRLRDKKLTQITEDHSVVQELLSRGLITPEEAQTAFNKNLVTRALGIEATVQVDVVEVETADGDVYLICSDGLSDVLADEEIEKHLLNGGSDLNVIVMNMINDVNSKGGPDNISIILVKS
jgi:serine/threonine protein phosphatase PrpC